MDKAKANSPRKQKQKQLGPAPICSFEKSFEDTSSDELKYKVNNLEVCAYVNALLHISDR